VTVSFSRRNLPRWYVDCINLWDVEGYLLGTVTQTHERLYDIQCCQVRYTAASIFFGLLPSLEWGHTWLSRRTLDPSASIVVGLNVILAQLHRILFKLRNWSLKHLILFVLVHALYSSGTMIRFCDMHTQIPPALRGFKEGCIIFQCSRVSSSFIEIWLENISQIFLQLEPKISTKRPHFLGKCRFMWYRNFSRKAWDRWEDLDPYGKIILELILG
jgi:hypothetical protein